MSALERKADIDHSQIAIYELRGLGAQPFSAQAQARTTQSRPPNSVQRRIEAFSAMPRCELIAQPNEPQGFLASTAIAAQPRRTTPTILQLPPLHLLIAAARASASLL